MLLQVSYYVPGQNPAQVNTCIARRHCPALGDPAYLTQHPTSDSLVV